MEEFKVSFTGDSKDLEKAVDNVTIVLTANKIPPGPVKLPTKALNAALLPPADLDKLPKLETN